jgi:transposase
MPVIKLKEADVREILRLRKEGLLISAIAKRFKVSSDNLECILRGRTWKRITGLIGLPPKKDVGAAGHWIKLKEADLKEVVRLRKKGLSCRAIAEHVGDIVTPQQIHKIISGKCRSVPLNQLRELQTLKNVIYHRNTPKKYRLPKLQVINT